MKSRLLVWIILALATGAARADDSKALWYVQIDNDVIFQTDRWYTSGVRVARSFPAGNADSAFGVALREWLRPANARAQRFEWGLVQEIYTPNTNLDTPAPVDRPYAGRLLLTAARHDELSGGLQTLEVEAGVRGPSALGRQAQAFVHRFVPSPHDDWSRQLPDRFDGAVVGSRSWDIVLSGPVEERVVVHAGGVAGNIRAFVHSGVEFRAGHGGTTTIEQPALRFAATPPATRAADGWSAFAGASARYVLRDELLVGNDHPLGPPLTRNRAILRSAVGFAWHGRLGTATFAIVQDTREFQEQTRNDRFGILGLTLELF
ncbi:MAG: lipid A-modifier LpxR family protein [Bacillota bacterium]